MQHYKMRTGAQFVIYTRCSGNKQEKKGYSHEYQCAGIREHSLIKRRPLHEVGYYSDTVTGTEFDNRTNGLDAAYLFCKRNKTVKYLLVFRLDRLGRDVHECTGAIKRFQKIGVEVNCPDEWVDYSGTDWPLVVGLKFGLAQSESLKISDRTRSGIKAAKEMGLYPSKAPVGYTKETQLIHGKERAVLVPCPINAQKIRDLFNDLADGMTLSVAQKKHMKGIGVQKSHFQRIPNMPVYAGLIYVAESDHAPSRLQKGAHEGIVTPDLFQRVQDVLKARKARPISYSTNDTSFYLKGLILDHAGQPMTAYTSTGRHGGKFKYYGPQGKGETIRAEKAHGAIETVLQLFNITEQARKDIEAHIRTLMQQQAKQAQEAIRDAEQRQQKADERRKRIKMLLADGGINGADYSEIKSDIDAQEADALKEIAQAQLLNTDIEQTFLRASAFLTNICTIFAGANVECKKKILRAVFPSGFFIEKSTNRVRTPEINQIIGLICSLSSDNTLLEIKNGAFISENPAKGGQAGKLRTHADLLMSVLAA